MIRLSSIAGAAALVLARGGAASAQQFPVVINNIDLVKPMLVDGLLTATGGTVSGTLNGLPFTTSITNLSLDLAPDDPLACPILHLELAPIHLSLLGLHVDTSAICLDITADPEGGLLGEVLCGLSGLDTNEILGGLETILTQVLGDVLNTAQPPAQGGGHGNGHAHGGPNAAAQDSVCTGDCEILHLVLGPVTLNLLGLVVNLDDCDEGPVQVCVSATRSEGILGGLLCSLAGPLLPGLDLGDIGQLIDLAQSLLQDGVLSNADIHVLRQLLRQLL